MSSRTVVELADMNDRDREELLSIATDRFERRLAEENGRTRSEIADLRNEMARLHLDTARQVADVRLEVAQSRLEFTEQFASSKSSADARHNELLKWAFVYWLGQAIAIAGLLAALR